MNTTSSTLDLRYSMGCCASKAVGKYDDYYWSELPKEAKDAAVILGYTKELWDDDQDGPHDDKDWKDLTSEQQQAAIVLGYDEEKWDGDDSSSSSSEEEEKDKAKAGES